MLNRNTSLLNAQDCRICRTVFGFLSTPLLLIVAAATIHAL